VKMDLALGLTWSAAFGDFTVGPKDFYELLSI
jgi:hypothetical protein